LRKGHWTTNQSVVPSPFKGGEVSWSFRCTERKDRYDRYYDVKGKAEALPFVFEKNSGKPGEKCKEYHETF
jgi:hypothetical protein